VSKFDRTSTIAWFASLEDDELARVWRYANARYRLSKARKKRSYYGIRIAPPTDLKGGDVKCPTTTSL